MNKLSSLSFMRKAFQCRFASICKISVLLLSLSACQDPLQPNIQVEFKKVTPISISSSTVVASSTSLPADGASPVTILVTLRDQNNNPVPNKKVSLTSSRASNIDLITPISTDISNSKGVVAFTIKAVVAGTTVITAYDITDNIALSSSSITLTFTPGPSLMFSVSNFPSSFTPGAAASFTVTVQDLTGATVSGYLGTVNFVSDDPNAVLPAPYTFTGADAGSHTFPVTFASAGFRKIMLWDSANNISGTQPNLIVNLSVSLNSFSNGYFVNATNGAAFSLSGTCSGDRGSIFLTATDGSATSTASATCGATQNSKWLGVLDLRTLGTTVSVNVRHSDAFGQLEYVEDTKTLTNGYAIADSGASTIIVTPVTVEADNTSQATAVVTLRNAAGQVVAHTKSVSLVTTLGTVINSPATTNSVGQVSFYIRSNSTGTATLTATNATDSVVLSTTGKILFLAATPLTDYQAQLFDSFRPGNNSSTIKYYWKNLASTSTANDGVLYGFNFSSSGWAGTGTGSDPYRLVFSGSHGSYVDFGTGINNSGSSDFSFETWVQPTNLNSSGIILSNGDLKGHGITLQQSKTRPGRLQLTLGQRSYADEVLADSPAIYYRMNETSKGTVADSSGNARNGSHMNSGGITLNSENTSGPINEVDGTVSLDGVSSYIDAPNQRLKTIEFFYNPRQLKPMSLFEAGQTNTNGNFVVHLYKPRGFGPNPDTTTSWATTYGIYVSFWGNDVAISAPKAAEPGWHHLVVSWSGGESVLVGIDGEFPSGHIWKAAGGTDWSESAYPQDTLGIPLAGGQPNPSTSGPIHVGASSHLLWGDSNNGARFFDGQMDEFAAYTTFMTKERILEHYNARLRSTCVSVSAWTDSTLWYFLTGVFNDSVNLLQFYVNGTKQCALQAPNSQSYGGSDYPWSAGNVVDPTSRLPRDRFWSGSMSDFRTYNQALADGEVYRNYIATKTRFNIGLAALTDFQSQYFDSSGPGHNSSPSKTIWKDLISSSSIHDGNLYGFDFSSSGWAGTGSTADPYRLVFTGSQPYINFGTGINATSTSDFSFETWVQPTNVSSTGVILSNGDLSGHGFTLQQSQTRSGRLQLTLGQRSYADEILADSPTLYYRMNESSTGIVKDSSANRDGAHVSPGGITLNPENQSGPLNETDGTVALNGTSAYISAPNSSLRTFEFFYNPSLQQQTGLLQSGIYDSLNDNFAIHLYRPGGLGPNSTQTSTWATTYGVYVEFNDNDIAIPAPNAADPGWHHLVVSWNGSQSVLVGIDGQFPAGHRWNGTSWSTQAIAQDTQGIPLVSGQPTPIWWFDNLRIGSTEENLWDETTNSSRFFAGQLDEFAAYTTSFTKERILEHYNARSRATCLTPSVWSNSSGWYHLSGVLASSSKIVDLYVNGVKQCTLTASSSQSYVGSNYPWSAGNVIDPVSHLPGNRFWSGSMAEFRTYDKTLTASEAWNNFNNTKLRFIVAQ